jgi:16S rRNA (adenine1518-N6/adenine1519-N6)-dimethyltransferase
LIVDLLLAGVDLVAFTVQREVADRLKAKHDTEDYGPLTVMVQLLGEVEVLRILPPQAFWPQPKIESSLVRIRRRDQLGAVARDFSRFVQKVFSFRRKTLRKALSQAGFDAEPILSRCKVDGNARVEVLPPDKLLEMFNAAAEK